MLSNTCLYIFYTCFDMNMWLLRSVPRDPVARRAYMSYTLVTNVRNPRQCLTKVKAQVHPTGASIDAPVTNSMPINSKSTL